VTEERRRRSTGAVENLDVPIYRTLAGDELDYPAPSEQLARFLDRVTEAANDPAIEAGEMTDLIYGPDNPLLGPSTSALPERRSVSRETWANPTWHMMLDLLEAKRIAVAESSSTMSLEEAGALLGITEDAVRKAAIAGTLDGEKRANRWYVTPGSVATYRDRVRRRGRWPATPLLIRCGTENGYSLKTKTAKPGTKKRVRRHVVDVTISDFERMLIRLRWTNAKGERTRRVLVLEPDPSTEPWTFTWPPRSDGKPLFFIKGRFRFAEKFNNPAKAAAAWKEIEPA